MVKVRERDNKFDVFYEWRQSFGKFQYTIGLEGIYYSLFHPVRYSGFYLNPQFTVRFKSSTYCSISATMTTDAGFPSVNQLNAEMQRIDNYQWSTGNLNLRPFQRYDSKIAVDFQIKNILLQLTVTDRYSRNPVMGRKYYSDGAIVSSYINSGYNNNVEIRGLIRMPLFLSGLTLSLEGGWHDVVSKGIDYRHCYSQPFVNAQLMYMMKGWWAMVKYNTTYNNLWGEILSSVNQNLLNLGVGYTYRNATFMVGIVNPFGYVALRTKDFNKDAGYDRTYIATSSGKLLWLGISLNLHKGARRSAVKKRLENSNIYETINNQLK